MTTIDRIQNRVQNEVQVDGGWTFSKENASKLFDNILILSLPEEDVLRVECINLAKDERGKGHGSRVMQIICEEADRDGMIIELEAYPLGEATAWDIFDLMRWYRRFGFQHADHVRKGLAAFFRWARTYTRSQPVSYSAVKYDDLNGLWEAPFWMIREF